jgi:hypothetical protein
LSATSCYDCESGTFWREGICYDCPLGFYQNQTAQSTCFECPTGYSTAYSKSKTPDCSSCQTNYIWGVQGEATVCTQCQGMSVAKTGRQTSCFYCESGKYTDIINGECVDCPQGSWNNNSAASYCSACPKIFAVSCPPKSSVPFVAGGGWFRSLDAPDVILPCNPAESCFKTGLNSTECSLGYGGIQCSNCALEYFRNAGRCIKCLPQVARIFIISFTLVVFIILLSRISDRQTSIPPSLRLLLFWLQFLSLLPALSDAWPPYLLSFLSITSLFNLDIGYLGVGCDVKSSYMNILTLKVLMPIMFFVVLLLECVILQLFRRLKEIKWTKLLSSFTFITNFFAVQILSSLLQIFSCTDGGRGTMVMKQDPQALCYDTPWYQFVVFVVIFLVAYFLIFPAFLAVKFTKAKKHGDHQVLNLLFRPLFHNYREGCEWFELIRLASRVIFVLVRDVFNLTGSAKVSFLALMLMVLLYIETQSLPYTEKHYQSLSLL